MWKAFSLMSSLLKIQLKLFVKNIAFFSSFYPRLEKFWRKLNAL